MNPRVRWLAVLVVLGGAGAGAYFVYKWLNPPASPNNPPPVHTAHGREAVPVPKVKFTDATDAAKIRFTHFNGPSGRKLLPETMGSGVAFLDYDNDGFQDVLFVNSCPWPGGKHEGPPPTPALYRNKGDGTFEDVTKGSGLDVSFYGIGVAVGDYDNDGFSDVFISCIGRHHLFHNEQGKGFRDITDAAQVGGPGKLPDVSRAEFLDWKEPIPFGASCTFVDYDGDGKLDLFVCHYITWSPKIDQAIGSSLGGGRRDYVQPKDFEAGYCALYRNLGGGKFEDVSEAAGVRVSDKDAIGPKARKRPVGKSLGVVICDPDKDGWPDLIVANDTTRNFFFHNVAGPDGKRRYEEVGYLVGAAYADEGKPRGGMGIDWGEYLPGRFAALVANFANEPDTFLCLEDANAASLRFSDAALAVCVAGPSREWLKFGAFFFDYDLDGRLDILTCNGHIEPDISSIQSKQSFAQPAQLFWNTGDPVRVYEPVTAADAGADLFRPMVGRGSAFADVLNNGRLAVVLCANGGKARFLRNDYAGDNHWVRLHLKGDGERSNRSAIGARVVIEADGQTLHRQVTGGRGYLSQSELPLTVGLGAATKVDRVTVYWPGKDLKPEVWTDLAVSKTHALEHGKAGK
jgi:hypothetical protein